MGMIIVLGKEVLRCLDGNVCGLHGLVGEWDVGSDQDIEITRFNLRLVHGTVPLGLS
jgi:hypothetical protein